MCNVCVSKERTSKTNAKCFYFVAALKFIPGMTSFHYEIKRETLNSGILYSGATAANKLTNIYFI